MTSLLPDDQEIVKIDHVTKSFDSTLAPALNDLSISINKGKIVALAGPDGSGKTTLIRLIAGLLTPNSGKITVSGFDTIKEAEQIRSFLGYMPQKFGLYEDLTVMQNLILFSDLKGVVGKERNERFEILLKFTSLTPFKERLAGRLSGGMKQKLGLACALINKPLLLLLDEPSVGVDPISRRELWKMVNELLTEGISVVWSTAYLDEAERCDSVILLNEGKMLYQGAPQKLTQRVEGRVYKVTNIKANRRQILSELLNTPNIIDGTIQGDDVRILLKEDQLPSIEHLKEGSDLKIVKCPPRFEDAFIDILGGGPGGKSDLADKTPNIKEKKEVVIEAENLTKKFGNFTAAGNISFKVKSGEIFGLLGPNGAGKSTTFKMLCGLLTPTSGSAHVQGIDLQAAPGQARSHIGYMAQKFSLYGDLSVYENLKFFSGIYNLVGKKQNQAIEEMVEIFNFKQYLNETSLELPLGYKQRLALSCSVMHHPEVLFLDEPTSGVDPITRREFWNHINGLVEKGVTVMVTTHFMDEAEYCDRIGLVYRSKLIRVGTPDSLKNEAKTEQNHSPTLEDAFIQLIEQYDRENPNGS